MSLFEYEVYERARVSEGERDELMAYTDKYIIEYAKKARLAGPLALTPDIDRIPDVFTRIAYKMYIDGASQESVAAVLQNMVYSGDFRGKQLLKRIMVSEGILAIYAGENPSVIAERMKAFLLKY